jgi:hypothetical protein
MRMLLSFLVVVTFLLACNNEKKPVDDVPGKDTAVTTETNKGTTALSPAVAAVEEILGSFVGAFGDNKITLLITRALGDSVAGRSIVGGNDRPFAGTYKLQDGVYIITAREPGDHKDDGAFEFYINTKNFSRLTGSWKAYDSKRLAKTYELERKKFAYRTDVGSWPESSQRLLKPADVENLMKEDLEFMRNEIFARHGYCFNRKHLRQQFEMEDWYVPNTVDIKGFLTDIEKKNIEMIKRYEKYADEYGDEYGR